MRPASELRRSIASAYANGALWGVGNGLASVTLLIYLARQFNASGIAIAWLLAAPSLVGLLRLATPLWIDRIGSRRRAAIALFLASSAALAAVPAVAAPGTLPGAQASIVGLGAAWALYNLLEYMGVVALWSWFGALVPMRIRGRFVGRREAWMTAGIVLGGSAAAGGAWWWERHCEQIGAPELVWRFYAACAWFGAAMFALATLPLAKVIEPKTSPRGQRLQTTTATKIAWRDLWLPLADAKFRRLLYYQLWFSLSNGLVQSTRNIYFASVIKLSLTEKKALDAASRGAQVAILPWTGNVVDRRGNVPVLAAAQGIVALAPLFLLAATPAAKWWAVGAYACWVAYAGINVTLPNLMLGLSRPEHSASYAAAHFAWPQLAYSLSVLAGGWLFDWMAANFEPRSWLGHTFDHFAVLLALSWLMMTLGVALALRIREPRH